MKKGPTLALLLAAAALLSAAPASPQGKPRPKAAAPPPAPAVPTVDALALKALKARSIGPAIMGGRVSDIALDPKDPFTLYVAFGTGGLMKSADNGGTFQGLFEKEAVAAIGAVAVSPSDPKVVWVGSGEANDRNSSSWGNGVYLSTDSGGTWTNVGLKRSKAIARIVVHPTDPKTAWAAAAGDLWRPGGERGLFKTADGGATWKAVLTAPAPYADRVGACEVALDPKDPNTLYAALYARRRTPWSFSSGPEAADGKDLGGIFKSSDGGATWRKLGKGLPGATGRIGIDVSRKNPATVYAVVQSHEGGANDSDGVRSRRGGVFRSGDGGETWARASPLSPRPFYFSQIRVDPEDDQRIYVLGFALHVSEDGGRTFREDRFEKVHPDNHAFAIDPRHPRHLVLGTDGGVYQSFNGGETWDHLNRIAAGEFYRITADKSDPYRVCGGLQDNQTWLGPSRTRTKDGIVNTDWIDLGGGDGFYCAFDAGDPDLVYAESQQGFLQRTNLRNGEIKSLRPQPQEGQTAFRFHWNSPLIASGHAKDVLYLAGNRVFKLTGKGEEWALISPDLTARDPDKIAAVGSGAESYGVVYTLAESPVKAGMLWAGTDDGKVWVTEDEGGHWTDLTATLPAAAKGEWMSRIEASSHDAKVAYLAVDAHRGGSYKPFAYRTGDGGKTWQDIASNLPPDGPVKVIREDPANPSLLFAGTEFGLFASLDRGGRWTKVGELPTVAVDDIFVHPRDHDLVIATHGRSLYIIDDIRPLEELTPEVLAKDAHLFPPRPASAFFLLPGSGDWTGKAVFRGENPPEGALLTYFLKAYTGDPVKVAVSVSGGPPVANLTGPGTPGLNRIVWDLKPSKDLLTEYGGEGQKLVRSGEYTVTLTYGKVKQEQKLKVDTAPGIETR